MVSQETRAACERLHFFVFRCILAYRCDCYLKPDLKSLFLLYKCITMSEMNPLKILSFLDFIFVFTVLFFVSFPHLQKQQD